MGLSRFFCSILLLCMIVAPALAGSIGGSISALSGESDNATKTQLEPIDERQDEYQLTLAVDYENSLLTADADYLASQRHFSEESQEDEFYVDGKSSLQFGNPNSPADLLIKHSRRILLQEPDQVQITNNLDERDILSTIPTLRNAITDVDTLSLSGDYTRVSYAENELRDSSRVGGSLQWMHALSKVDGFRLVAQTMKIEFEAQPQADYKYQNSYIAYSVSLRSFGYNIQAGYNRSENDIQGVSEAPAYSFNAHYEKGAHEIDLLVMQQITDSSLGDNNTNSVDSIPGSDGSKEIHQLERLLVESRWTTTILCARCSAYLMFRNMDDEYITVNESATQTTAGVGFSYQFSRAAQLALSSENSRRKFDESIISNSYELNRILMNFNYQFSNHLRFKVIAWREDRENTDVLDGYTENYTGVGLSYLF